jgi:hypothetical protein
MSRDRDDELTDELPADLNAVEHVGAYRFPDNSRRRIPGVMYLLLGAGCTVLWATMDGSPRVNSGLILAAAILGAVGVFSLLSGTPMAIDEKGALAEASRSLDFPVGHASAQQVWRGLASRPTWRLFCYSSEDPPRTRALVLVDAVTGKVVEKLVEDNPDAASVGE